MAEDKKNVLKVDMGAEGVKTVKMDFPSNAHSDSKKHDSEDEPKQEKKVQKIIKGKAVQKKKSGFKKFFETFVGEDVNDVGSYIIHDVLIPAARDTLYDMVMGSLGISLYGDRRAGRSGRRDTRDTRSSYISYNNYSNKDRDKRDRREMSYKSRATHNFDDIVLESKGEADAVISQLVDLIEDYGQATVKDLYDSVDIESSFTDEKYGWVELNSASSSRTRGGWVLNLPRPVVLD